MLLDTRTVLILLCVGDMILFMLLVAIGRSLRTEGDLGYFPYGKLLQAVGLALFLLRGIFPGTLSVLLCNACFVAGLALESFCLTSIGKRSDPGSRNRWIAATTVICIIFGLAYFSGVGKTTRTFIYSLIAAGYTLAVALRLARGGATILRRTVGFFLLLVAVPLLPWVLDLLTDGPSATLFSDASVTAIAMLVVYVHMMISSISYLMIHREIIAMELETAATRDFLTGVYNRMQFLKLSSALMAEAVAQQSPVSILMIDLDEFKSINDNHGHAVGDQVLRYFCEQAAATIRKSDVFGRYGGDEFILFSPDTTTAQIMTVGERLRNLTHQNPPDLPAFRVSIGATTMVPQTVDQLEPLIAMADRALLRAKESGRDQITHGRYA